MIVRVRDDQVDFVGDEAARVAQRPAARAAAALRVERRVEGAPQMTRRRETRELVRLCDDDVGRVDARREGRARGGLKEALRRWAARAEDVVERVGSRVRDDGRGLPGGECD